MGIGGSIENNEDSENNEPDEGEFITKYFPDGRS